MMQRLERKVCECCGQSEFIQLDHNHVKCAYCDSVYFTSNSSNSVSEQEYNNWWQKNYDEACERREQELALEKTRREAFEREQFNKNMEKAAQLRKQCKQRVIVSIILNVFMILCCIENLSESESSPIFSVLFIVFIVLLIVRPKNIRKRKEFVWAEQFLSQNK